MKSVAQIQSNPNFNLLNPRINSRCLTASELYRKWATLDPSHRNQIPLPFEKHFHDFQQIVPIVPKSLSIAVTHLQISSPSD